MIGHNINHNPDTFRVCSGNQLLEVVLGAKVAVDLVPVTGPVTVVTFVTVVDGR